MIAYVHCLPSDPMVGCLHRSKWQANCNDDEEELILLYSNKMGNIHPGLHGRLKKRLLNREDSSLWPSKNRSCFVND